MNYWSIIATIAVALTALQLAPQIYKSFKTKKTRDISKGLSIIIFLTAFVWLIYGIHKKDAPLVIANSINLVASLTLFFLTLKHRSN